MSLVYSLYDALVSINVPDEKAKAVIDAMEREMMDKLAKKSDLDAVLAKTNGDFSVVGQEFKLVRQEMSAMRDSLTKDIQGVAQELAHAREVLSRDIQTMATKTELAELGRKLTTQLYLAISGSVALTCSILGTVIVLR
jgi:hypothetical protein